LPEGPTIHTLTPVFWFPPQDREERLTPLNLWLKKAGKGPLLQKSINDESIQGGHMLKNNQLAPIFSLPNQDNNTVSLADYHGKKNVVLYFYPKDDTPGCTIEANDFTRLAKEFAELDTVVIGVSKDSCESHQAFIKKFGLNVELLADTSGKLCESYGVWQEKEKQGVKKMGIVRSTFVINKEGVLAEAMYGVTAEGHAQAILDKVKQL
jgi:peroxiredoxin